LALAHFQVVARVTFALGMGVWVEGIAVWGMDPILVSQRPSLG
jgi:hypothetical protein